MIKLKITESELNQLDLFSLRDIARKAGVDAPTTKRKAELLAAVKERVEFAVEESGLIPKRRGRGRPAKNTPYHVENLPPPKSIIEIGEQKVKKTNPFETDYKRCVSAAEGAAYGDRYEKSIGENRMDRNQRRARFGEVSEGGEFNRGYGAQNNGYEQPRIMSAEEYLASGEYEKADGILDIHTDGYGFLRANNCEYGSGDSYITSKLIKMYGLRAGDVVEAIVPKRKPEMGTKPPAAVALVSVNGGTLENLKRRPSFDNLTPIYPNERLRLEMTDGKSDFAIRCIDMIAPIGKGQRAMIVSPPKAGKTTLLKKIATSIAVNHPEVELFVLLVDERPEEVTDMQRSIKGTVIYSTFDETPEHHCKSAELLIERAKRSVETGKDVVIIMDSLTRLARAYNLTIPPTGRSLSGGMDPGALHNPKRFFGSARNIENGGSLTIIATALVDTGSRMDDVIYEEFKGTGNMEIHLDRKLSERRIFPAIDLNKSSTRREDLLLSQKELEGVWAMRKMLSGGDNQEMAEQLINMIVKTKNNAEFIDNILLQMKALEKNGYSFRK